MKLPKCKDTRGSSTRSRGAVVPLVALSTLALLLLIGLALDGGRFFLIQQQLQRAADTAALAAVRSVRNNGPLAIINTGTQVFGDNLVLNGLIRTYAVPVVSLEPEGSPQPNRVSVRAVKLAAPFMLRLPGLGGLYPIEALAVAQFDRLILTLVLDVSGSMWCPADSSVDCAACFANHTCGYNPEPNPHPQPFRIDKLKEALRTLIANLDENRDRLSMVLFGGTITEDLPHRVQGQPPGFDKIRALEIVDGLSWRPATRTGSALRVGRLGFNNVPGSEQGTRTMILITDGATIGEDPATYSNYMPGQQQCFAQEYPGEDTPAGMLYAIWESDQVRAAYPPIKLHAIGFERQVLNPPNPNNTGYVYQMGAPQFHLYGNKFLGQRIVNADAVHATGMPQFQGVHSDGLACFVPPQQITTSTPPRIIPIAGDPQLDDHRGQYLSTYSGNELNQFILSLGISTPDRLIK